MRRPGRTERRCCWLCGISNNSCRDDMLFAPRALCRACWTTQPLSGHRDSRAASTVIAVLDLGTRWRDSLHRGWAVQVARRRGILAWDDTPPSVGPFDTRFGWIGEGTREAARADLLDLAAEHARQTTPGAGREPAR